ncbi:MAG: DUF47 family protein [Elusimicrobia bacterium]|nr:DUF47 family protein [Elusimicrobiota bacterium]
MWPFPKRRDFFQMLLEQAEKTEQGITALTRFVAVPTPELGRLVSQIEKEADELRRSLIQELNQAFVTPIDREDIFALSRAIDDMIDYANSTVEEMLLFSVGTNPHLTRMAEALSNAAQGLTAAVRAMRYDALAAQQHLIRVKKTENLVEHLYREALVELFQTPDVVLILKTRELYRHLSNAADRGDEAANIISDLLVKNA